MPHERPRRCSNRLGCRIERPRAPNKRARRHDRRRLVYDPGMPRLQERAPALSKTQLSLACVAAALVLYWVGVPLLDGIELRSYDLRFRSRGPVAPASDVVLAVVDEKSLDVLGRFPWPRTRMAELVDALSADGARV